ncbi:MAG: hypothetical protein Q9172_002652 [Xanthocarpia lactea]
MSDTSDSDDDGAAAEKADLMDDLRRLISEVHTSGSFAAFDTINSFVNPGIFIDPIGMLRLPLSEDDAQALAQTSHKAPFGKGNETLVDESVRKTWQIDAANVRISNKDWQLCLDRILEHVAKGLGIPGGPSSIRAELYKMLLYEKRAMFKPHQDTEKVPGMFGTLIICLPSEHTGGAVCLRHGSKSERFDSSGSSAFGASYLTWFIEPIQTGYRWVLAYNLINHSPGPRSASALDAQIDRFTQALTRWQGLQDKPRYLAYPLDHQYTKRDLKLAHLKGDDFYRARHVARSCEAHGEYYMLLGNMEMCITNQNSEEEMEDEAVLSLCRIVDPQGFNLLIHSTLSISTANLLRGQSYENREPDVQRGGNYLGNQYAEIDQFFNDSIMIIVPSQCILNMLLGKTYTHRSLDSFMARLRGFIEQTGNSNIRGLLLQVCQIILGQKHANNEDRDLHLGPVAVSAAFLRNPDLFNATASQIKASFNTLGYSINTTITRCGKIYKIHENLNAFRDGFFEGNPNRLDTLQGNNLKRWLDALLYSCLYDSKQVYEQDASTLVKIIVEREDAPFSQYVLYQGARIFIKCFQNNSLLTNPLVIELLLHTNHQGRSKIYLETLLRNIIEPAISNFNLPTYAIYAASIIPPSQPDASNRSRGQEANVTSSRLAGPIKAFYEYASACSQELPALLLQRIEATASELTVKQSNSFLISFLSELIPVAYASSIEAQSCMRSLITLYIIRTVGHEPKKPTDWTRLEEVTTCFRRCDHCLKMNTFLKDPEVSYYALADADYHLQSQFKDFRYFDEDKRTGTWFPVGVTKTNKWWEEQHPKWQTRAEAVLQAIKKLPQDRLKEFLGSEYDGIMDLKMVRVVDDAVADDAMQTQQEGKGYPGLASSVPQKRVRESSE